MIFSNSKGSNCGAKMLTKSNPNIFSNVFMFCKPSMNLAINSVILTNCVIFLLRIKLVYIPVKLLTLQFKNMPLSGAGNRRLAGVIFSNYKNCLKVVSLVSIKVFFNRLLECWVQNNIILNFRSHTGFILGSKKIVINNKY